MLPALTIETMKCGCTHLGQAHCKSCGCINNPNGTGHKANGDNCSNTVIPGTHRCHMHGGSTPVALFKAREALALLRMPAIEVNYLVLETLSATVEQFAANTCPTCGYPKGDIDELHAIAKVCAVLVKQAQTVLDRTEIGPKATLEVKQSDGDFDLKLLTDDERSRMMTLLAQVRDLKETIKGRIHGVAPAPNQIM